MSPRYPVYVPTKDRHQENRALTIRALQQDGVPFRIVVEPSQAEHYERWAGDGGELLVLPEDGLKLLGARNWIRDHAEEQGHARHWQLDDNVQCFYRLWEGRRVPVHAASALRVCEDLSDRFSNVGISGLNYDMFAIPGAVREPFSSNVHVYSCSLINHAMPYRWRLVYNDDTDLCLQALTNGWATILVSAFTAKKTTTMTVSGGNTDSLYRDAGEDRDTAGRYEMARVLEREWPGTVKLSRKFGRYQHSVNWAAFDVPLILQPRWEKLLYDLPEVDEMGMVLREVRPVRSPRIEKLRGEYPAVLAAASAPSPEWRGLPAFRRPEEPEKLTVRCRSEADRDALVRRLGVTVDKRYKDKAWSAWWPPRGRDDPASLRFEPARIDGPEEEGGANGGGV